MEINNKKTGFTSKVKADPGATVKDAAFYYRRAVKAYNSRDYEEAEKDFNHAVEADQNSSLAYFNRGTFYYNEKRYKPAIEDFQKAIKLRAKFAEAYYNLGCSYVKILSFREGLNNLKKAIKIEKGFANMAIADQDFSNVNNMKEFKEITLVV